MHLQYSKSWMSSGQPHSVLPTATHCITARADTVSMLQATAGWSTRRQWQILSKETVYFMEEPGGHHSRILTHRVRGSQIVIHLTHVAHVKLVIKNCFRVKSQLSPRQRGFDTFHISRSSARPINANKSEIEGERAIDVSLAWLPYIGSILWSLEGVCLPTRLRAIH